MKKKTKPIVLWMLVTLVLALFVLVAAERIAVKKIVSKVTAAYEERMKGIEDFIIITDRGTTYYKRTVVGNQPTYKMRSETEIGGRKIATVYDGMFSWSLSPLTGQPERKRPGYDPYGLWKNLKNARSQLEFKGIRKVDGHKSCILAVSDFSKLMQIPEVEGAAEKEKMKGKIWIDAKDWVLRKVIMEVKWQDNQGKKRTGETIISMKDYREINGMCIPFVTEIAFPQVITPKEGRRIRKKVEEIREELRKMPPARRETIGRMMESQVNAIESILRGQTVTTKVQQVKVNTGLSDALFDGSQLE